MNLRNNYFVKLIRYINNAYHIDKQIEHIHDKRVNPTLVGFLLRVTSFNQLSCMIKCDEFDSLITSKTRIPRIDAIRSSLKSIDLSGLRKLNKSIIRKAVRNKVLDEGTIDGYTVAAIDGTRLFRTQKSHCDDCLYIINKEKAYYYHECSVMSLIGEGANLVIDYEMTKRKGNGKETSQSEIKTSKKLLNRAVSDYNGLIDVLTYDALALTSQFINECLGLGIDAVIRVKGSYNLTINNVKRVTNKKDLIIEWYEGNYRIRAYESIFDMPGVEQPLRYIKFAKKHKNGDHSQMLVVTTSMNMSIKTVYRIMKARWNIENRVFNNLKNNANLNHCFVHGGNATEAVLYLMFIASNLFQLFKVRRLRNHITLQKELIRLLLKGLYLIENKDRLLFSSA